VLLAMISRWDWDFEVARARNLIGKQAAWAH